MKFIELAKEITLGAGIGVGVITALPFFGAVGTITAVGVVVGSVGGAVLGGIDALNDQQKS